MRFLVPLLLCAVLLGAEPPPERWLPLRWDGGPLEVERRRNAGAEYNASAGQEQAVREWYREETLALLDETPYNVALLTWSLGGAAEEEREQRELASAYAAQVREKGLLTFAVIGPGPEWLAAVSAAAPHFHGAVLEGEFPPGAAARAHEAFASHKPGGIVIALGAWDRAERDPLVPVLGASDGIWPGQLASDDADGWASAPTSNPWVLSNAWRVEAVRAGDSRPVWLGHRPKPHRPQPLELNDYVRALADSAMAGGRWIVSIGDEWRPALLAGEEKALDDWRELAERAAFFDGWRSRQQGFEVVPSAVVVHDPGQPGAFDSFDLLNMLSVRHVPHRVVLREDLPQKGIEPHPAVILFDHGAPAGNERDALEALAQGGGELLTGPRWARERLEAGDAFPKIIPGKGSLIGHPQPEVDPDQFSKRVRDLVDKHHAAPKLYNVGSLATVYREDPKTGRALIEMTEYSDYPTENVTIKLPRKFTRAEYHALDQEPEELEIYPGEDDGVEIDIPSVPFWAAVFLD